MKVVAFNSSPMMGKGSTALILGPFLEGMEKAGADVQLFYTKKLDVKPCQGDFHCWTRHPGECFQKDDMAEILPHLREADVWVLATPLFVDGMTGPMKTLLDRMIPLIVPAVEMVENHSRHPRREGTKGGKLVLVSNSGFWEMDNFDPLLAHIRAVCKNVDREFAGALLRPHGPALGAMKKNGLPIDDVLDAAEEAGRQLVVEGRMVPETMETVSRELLPRDLYVQNLNERFEASIAKWTERRS